MSDFNCDMNCLECKYEDCLRDSMTLEEYAFSRQLDKDNLKEQTVVDYGVGSRQNRKPYDVKYFNTHREAHLVRCETYRKTHPEERRQTSKKYYEKNKEKIRDKQREFYQENIEEQRLKKRLYYQQNKDKINARRKERRLQNANSKD